MIQIIVIYILVIKFAEYAIKKVSLEKYIEILISINKNDFNKSIITDILSKYLMLSKSSCENCSYYNEKRLKEEYYFSICNNIFITNIIFQKFLFFCIDLIYEGKDDITQYNNLVNNKTNYRHLINEKFTTYNNVYVLKAAINQKNINHYTYSSLNITENYMTLIVNKIIIMLTWMHQIQLMKIF